jgi:hypothetical protein
VQSEIYINAGRAYVEQMLEIHQDFKGAGTIINDPSPVYEFLLLHGQEFQGTKWTTFRGRGYRKMRPRQCFYNAWIMSLARDDLTYYEGFAYSGLITVHHAWCIDSDGLVVDPTWRAKNYKLPENEWDYFGVGFDSHMLSGWWVAKSTASVLFDLDYSSDVGELVVIA